MKIQILYTLGDWNQFDQARTINGAAKIYADLVKKGAQNIRIHGASYTKINKIKQKAAAIAAEERTNG